MKRETEAQKRARIKYWNNHKKSIQRKQREKYHKNAHTICEKQRLSAQSRYGRARRSANERNIDFNLSKNEFIHIWESRKSICPVLHIPLTHPSVDRIDNDIGYNLSNVQCISTKANDLKRNGTATEHMQIAVHAFNLSKEKIIQIFEKEISQLERAC